MAGMTIAAQVEEMKRSGPDEPDPRMAAFAREQAALAHVAVPAGVAGVGTRLPDVELLGVDGSPRSLAEAAGEGHAVLVLYRGAWCPYCNLSMRTYQSELLPAMRERGTELIALSPQKPDGSLTMKEKHELEFVVLSDPGLAVARAIGVVTRPAEESLAAQVELGLDLGEVNADGTPALPMPTVAIVDGELTIRWIDVHPDYTARSEPEEILAALDRLEGRS
ncbi:MAG TPA: peroxiredoxin-like family protein [Solirubrobacterales bacterium]